MDGEDEIPRLLQKFREMFPGFSTDTVQDYQNSDTNLKSKIMAMICNSAVYAFQAYRKPPSDEKGFLELSDACEIQHLNWDCVVSSLKGLFEIKVESASNVTHQFGISSILYNWESYAEFTVYGSSVRTRPKKNSVWDSTRYLPLRKTELISSRDNTITVRLLDTNPIISRRWYGLETDRNLGVAKIDISDLLDGKEHRFENFQLEHSSNHATKGGATPPSITFSIRFVRTEEGLEKMNLHKGSDMWANEDIWSKQDKYDWTDLALVTPAGKTSGCPVAYIDSLETGTQAFIFANIKEKTALVSFRGTEINELNDILTDLKFARCPLSMAMMSCERSKMKPGKMLHRSDIRIHLGFRRAYDSVREPVLQILYDITKWRSNWTVTTCGHSLGGALASICAFDIANRKIFPIQENQDFAFQQEMSSFDYLTRIDETSSMGSPEGEGPKTVMVSFGAPRCGNKAYAAAHEETVDLSFRIVNPMDIVTHLPSSKMMSYTHTGNEVVMKINGEVQMGNRVVIEEKKGDYALPNAPNLTSMWRIDAKISILMSAALARFHSERYYYQLAVAAITNYKKAWYSISKPVRVTKSPKVSVDMDADNLLFHPMRHTTSRIRTRTLNGTEAIWKIASNPEGGDSGMHPGANLLNGLRKSLSADFSIAGWFKEYEGAGRID